MAAPDYIPSMKIPRPLSTERNNSDSSRHTGLTNISNSTERAAHSRSNSTMSASTMSFKTKGRPVVLPPDNEDPSSHGLRTPSGSSGLKPSSTYVERVERRAEREQVRVLREALQKMDLDDDLRLYDAAQKEASDLVWHHQNPNLPYKVPANSPEKKNTNTHVGHTQDPSERAPAGSKHSRAQSQGSRPESASSSETRPPSLQLTQVEVRAVVADTNHGSKVHNLWDSPGKKAYVNLTYSKPCRNPRKTSGPRTRNVSGASTRSVFSNPDDQIYEEPEEVAGFNAQLAASPSDGQGPLQPKAESSVNKSAERQQRHNTVPQAAGRRLCVSDIHKNPPTQTCNPEYVTNPVRETTPEPAVGGGSTASPPSATIDGVEIRSEDIRQATSMKLKDRSPKLPTPAFVSKDHNRPIVSFDQDWKPREVESNRQGRGASLPLATSGTKRPKSHGFCERSQTSPLPIAPAINVIEPPSIQSNESHSSTLPIINVEEIPSQSTKEARESEPISGSTQPASSSKHRPLPTPGRSSRPLPHTSNTTGAISTPSHTPSFLRKPTACCAQCGLAIAGRIVSAAGERFHPECFTCFNCGEGLECVAFYPEPEAKRAERIDRIRRRAEGLIPDGEDRYNDWEDGDESLRFYCHLDFHELFSPRCRSCKTPIEGEVIVACGGEWHAGHFFCAQCGDVSCLLFYAYVRRLWLRSSELTISIQPFDSATPFVERDGYAWCVNCHTNRFSTKCKKCRKPVTEMVVNALGHEWHPHCFCCTVSLSFSTFSAV